MFRVILAEDEPLVRMGIRSMVNWEEMDMQVVAECADGEEAWKAFEAHRPDLIITDLKMPVMDGMELVRRVRSADKRVRILMLICIEDIDCARQIFEYDVSSYILKLSCTKEKFTGVLSRIRDELAANMTGGAERISQPCADTPEQNYPRKIAEALAIIREDYSKPIGLQSVADDLNISAGYLSRLFLSAMGRTFTETLNRVRVERAKQLLRDRNLTAYKVGEMVGIGNATYFIRVFKKYTGETPNEYRLKCC